MDNAHLDLQSQNYFCIKSSESKIDWSDVYKIKIILSQPSPNWKVFGIDDVKIVRLIQLQTHTNDINDVQAKTKNVQFKTEQSNLYNGVYIC